MTNNNRVLLKKTTSRCPACRIPCPAEVWREEGQPARVLLNRTCPEHGKASICIASDARFYWLAKGDWRNAANGCLDPVGSKADPGGFACSASDGSRSGALGRNAGAKGTAPFETLSTCLALIEIVDSCNLSCPTCYADSPVGTGPKVDAVPLESLQRRIQGVIDRKGRIEILQLSGGEPTLHPQFFELMQWARDHPGIDYLLLNTNGVRLANDPGFASRLGEIFVDGGLQLYLQFDGVQSAAQHALRGADLRLLRERAVQRCADANIPITLAMTVTLENLPNLWEAIEFGLKFPGIHGITFQPLFGSGRISPSAQASSRAAPTRLNTADVLLAAVGQSSGRLRFDDFTPLPCGDPNCATIGYLIRTRDRTYSISDFLDFSQVQGFLKDKVHYTMEDLAKCGCENEPLGTLLKNLELKSSNTFRLMVKPFMDAWTWDEDRIDRCCTHVIRPDGKLDSFCRYYSGFANDQEKSALPVSASKCA